MDRRGHSSHNRRNLLGAHKIDISSIFKFAVVSQELGGGMKEYFWSNDHSWGQRMGSSEDVLRNYWELKIFAWEWYITSNTDAKGFWHMPHNWTIFCRNTEYGAQEDCSDRRGIAGQ